MGIDGADSASKTSINHANRKRKGKGSEDKKGKEKVREPTTTYDKMSSQGVNSCNLCFPPVADNAAKRSVRMWEQKVLLIQKWEQNLHDYIPTCYTCSDDHGFK